MDITKIDEARKLFETYEQVNHLHGFAIKEYEELLQKHLNFPVVEKKKLQDAIRTTLNRHFETLKQELKVKIAQL